MLLHVNLLPVAKLPVAKLFIIIIIITITIIVVVIVVVDVAIILLIIIVIIRYKLSVKCYYSTTMTQAPTFYMQVNNGERCSQANLPRSALEDCF